MTPHVLIECVGADGPAGCGWSKGRDEQPDEYGPCGGCGGPHLVVTVSWPGQGATVARFDVRRPEDRVPLTPPPESAS